MQLRLCVSAIVVAAASCGWLVNAAAQHLDFSNAASTAAIARCAGFATLRIDSVEKAPMQVVRYGDPARPGVPTDTITVWPTYRRVSFNAQGKAVDSTLVAADGSRHQVDAIVLDTGFDVRGSYERIAITGLGGRTLADAWAEGMRTNLGITVAGFPELYVLLGPNTGLGHNSVVLMIELATRYVLDSIERARVAGPAATTTAVQEAFRREVDERSRHTVWTTGCHSWYLDEHGRNATLWPGSTVSYWWRTRRRRDADFTPLSSPTTTEANRVLAQ